MLGTLPHARCIRRRSTGGLLFRNDDDQQQASSSVPHSPSIIPASPSAPAALSSSKQPPPLLLSPPPLMSSPLTSIPPQPTEDARILNSADIITALGDLEVLFNAHLIGPGLYQKTKNVLIDAFTGTKTLPPSTPIGDVKSAADNSATNGGDAPVSADQYQFPNSMRNFQMFNSSSFSLSPQKLRNRNSTTKGSPGSSQGSVKSRQKFMPPPHLFPFEHKKEELEIVKRRLNGVILLNLLADLDYDFQEFSQIVEIVERVRSHNSQCKTPSPKFPNPSHVSSETASEEDSKEIERIRLLEQQLEGVFDVGISPKPSNFFQDNDADLEQAYKFTLDVKSFKWCRSDIRVKVDQMHFARGSFRKAFYCLEYSSSIREDLGSLSEREIHLQELTPPIRCVAKQSINSREHEDVYFRDVWVQMYAQRLAEEYNSYDPPKKIRFVPAWVIQLRERPDHPLFNVEHYIEGEYLKYNNNTGFVNVDLERNTPQAFSHFTYEATNRQLLVCDMQGVNDMYTDPQIHSILDADFGKGNLKEYGIISFVESHQCNLICQYLKLSPLSQGQDVREGGTVPETSKMSMDTIGSVSISVPSTESSSLLNRLAGNTSFPHSVYDPSLLLPRSTPKPPPLQQLFAKSAANLQGTTSSTSNHQQQTIFFCCGCAICTIT